MANDIVQRHLLLQGEQASNVTIDCNGAQIGQPESNGKNESPTIGIWSRQQGPANNPVWSRPTDVTIRGCKIHGNIVLWGIGSGNDIPIQISESRNSDFTMRAQRAAPTRIQIVDSQIHSSGRIPVYVGPGTSAVTLRGSTITGKTAIAIYLDAESANNIIEYNHLPITVDREIISIDGSAGNVIRNNEFGILGRRGGVLLYRNCGERGVIRHQSPSNNKIYGNRFAPGADATRLVIENARSGKQNKPSFCSLDEGYPFGSSINDDDLGQNNLIYSNIINK